MCELCNKDPKKAEEARREALYWSNQLDWLSGAYRKLANGTYKPHTSEWKRIERIAKPVLKQLFDDWF